MTTLNDNNFLIGISLIALEKEEIKHKITYNL